MEFFVCIVDTELFKTVDFKCFEPAKVNIAQLEWSTRIILIHSRFIYSAWFSQQRIRNNTWQDMNRARRQMCTIIQKCIYAPLHRMSFENFSKAHILSWHHPPPQQLFQYFNFQFDATSHVPVDIENSDEWIWLFSTWQSFVNLLDDILKYLSIDVLCQCISWEWRLKLKFVMKCESYGVQQTERQW